MNSASAACGTLTRFSSAAAAPARSTSAPPDPHRLQLRALADKATLGAVDPKTGRIAGVSLLTANREAAGHGVWIDQRTLETFEGQLTGRRLKAYATHGAWGGDGTLDEVGYWEGVRIDGLQLREDFQSLDAWRKHQEAEFDTLFELATKLPAEFGASLSFRMALVWVRADGSELPTTRKWRYIEGEGYETFFEPGMPADAQRDMPSVRCLEVYSADFVCVPAANDGLFRAAAPTAPIDGGAKVASPTPSTPSPTPALFSMNKELFAKFGSNPVLFAQAMQLHNENDKLSFAEIVAKVEGAQLTAELNTLRQFKTGIEADLAKFTAAGFKAAGDKSLIDVVLAEHASFKAKATVQDAAEAALKAAGFEAKDGKTATELALAANKKLAADIATLRAGGTVPVDTGKPAGDPAAAQLSASPISRAASKFAAQAAAKKPGNN